MPALQLWGRAPTLDPFALVHAELESVSERLRRSVFTEIPALSTAAEYFFKLGAEGKRLRPTMLLLMASALSAASPSASLLQVPPQPLCEMLCLSPQRCCQPAFARALCTHFRRGGHTV